MIQRKKTHVLLTVPHLHSTQSPYREMMAFARYLPVDEFNLTICSLRSDGYQETAPILERYGRSCFVARFRPRGKTLRQLVASIREQTLIEQRGPFDIQHSLDFTPSPFEAFMAVRRGRKFVFSQRSMNEGGSNLLLRIKMRKALRIIAISQVVRRFLIAQGAPESRIDLIYNGIDFSTRELKEECGQLKSQRILSVGHIERRKRHEDSIRALSILLDQLPEARLQIAGKVHDHAYFGELKSLIAQLKLDGKVDFLGVRTDVLELMSESAVLLHCAESEAFGWVILEAMTAGLPVVCAAVDGPKEIISNERTGFLVSPGNVETLANSVIRIIKEQELRRDMIVNAREQLLAKFTAKKMIESVADVYRRLI